MRRCPLDDTAVERESLRRVRAEALSAFPAYREQIDRYVDELVGLVDVRPDPARDLVRDAEAAFELLCKLEDYLESIMVGSIAKSGGR